MIVITDCESEKHGGKQNCIFLTPVFSHEVINFVFADILSWSYR